MKLASQLIATAFIFFGFLNLKAQERLNINTINKNQQELKQDIRDNIYVVGLSSVIDRYIFENKQKPGTSGYRVQLFFGSREEANKIKSDYLKIYPEGQAYVEYQAPNFKVRVGNFRSQIEAEKYLYEIKEDFPSAYVVDEWIELPPL